MRLLGSHFVIGQTIEEASRAPAAIPNSAIRSTCWARAPAPPPTRINISTLMRRRLSRSARDRRCKNCPGISVKLSALHPRYEAISRQRVRAELTPRLLELARLAKSYDLQFTVDAEEADRLELSLEIIGAALEDNSLARLGGIWAGGAGLSETRAGGDRLGRGAGGGEKSQVRRCGW